MKRLTLLITGSLLFAAVLTPLAFAQEKDAEIEMEASVETATQGQEFDVDIMIQNPGRQNIISVRAWLEYNPAALEEVGIVTEETPFTLSAPGETEFSPEEGYVKIGRSNIQGGVSEAEIKVATVRFRVKTPYAMTTVIEPYDFQTTELGHTSVNIIDAGFPINILEGEPEDVLVQLNPGGPVLKDGDGMQDEDLSDDIGGIGEANLDRPQNLRVNTGPGYADLRWDLSDEPELMGYNIYYGKTSGQYTRRRTVPNINQYRIDGLNNNEVYYFALTAFDSLNRESDYSDEVAVIINELLSSTAPFEELLASLIPKIPEQPQNGPLVGWLAFSAMGLSGAMLLGKKKK
jgi:hypothetical protein